MKTDFNAKIPSSDPESISNVFQNQRFTILLQKTRQITEIKELLKKILPPEIMQHVQIANIDSEQLVLILDNANWGLMIRYQEEDILKLLRQVETYKNIQKIRYRVSPSPTASQIPKPTITSATKTVISSKSAKTILCIAEGIKDPLLKESLLRLANSSTC